ncbi:MAG: C39 family peptidase [Pirellulales bacterium]|nr:C39 family peptidase [Pirellulales bacterium]
MESRLHLDILPQPNDSACGPTCLHAVYRYFGDSLPLEQVMAQTARLEEGGTLAAMLGCHALDRGYEATIYTYNLLAFDPTWFTPTARPLEDALRAQMAAKAVPKLHTATQAYLSFLCRGGTIRMEDLTTALIRKYLNHQIPILTGLSATYLYRNAREYGPNSDPDDIRGEAAGHFVVLCGYDRDNRSVLVADPLHPNPLALSNMYLISIDRVIGAILLGILTYDANLLIIEPRKRQGGKTRADFDRRQ